MGWLSSEWFNSLRANKSDPLEKLDPKLREFLERESPVKYTTAQQDKEEQQQGAGSDAAKAEQPQRPVVPAESLFPDGRYAHLWKTYRTKVEIEAETKPDSEKLQDVLEGFKDRRRQIGRAALENCALEQLDWRECMSNPTFTERMSMCRTKVKQFEKCYMMQTRLLKAVGYLSIQGRTDEQEEEIQMHADKLYHQMMEQEAQIDAAKAEGAPLPNFEPLETQPPVVAAVAADEELTETAKSKLQARLKGLSEDEWAAEEQAFRAEERAKLELHQKIQGLWAQQAEERKARKERGEARFWEKVTDVFRAQEPKKP